jgi:hypothetical protein
VLAEKRRRDDRGGAARNHEASVSDSTQPTLDEILAALERLGDRVAASHTSRLDGFVSLSLRRACEELRRFIPGLDLPPDSEGARFMARSAHAALEDGNAREALSRALRGMALAPHHPGLFYLAASACFEFGAVEDAVRLLRHTLWIHPGHRPARRDLSALNLYLRDRWEGPGEMSADESYDAVQAAPAEPDLAFDLSGDDFDLPAPPNRDEFDPPLTDEGEDRAA